MTAVQENSTADMIDERLYNPECDHGCGRPATVVAKGCSDKEPVLMCDECLERGIGLIRTFLKLYMRHNKRVPVCEHCYRPFLTLDTHIDVHRLHH